MVDQPADRRVPPGYVVLDGLWARRQANEAIGTLLAPVLGVARYLAFGPHLDRGLSKTPRQRLSS